MNAPVTAARRNVAALPARARPAAEAATMPPEAPLACVPQYLDRPFRDPRAPGVAASRRAQLLRFLVFLGAPVLSAGFVALLAAWLSAGGFRPIEMLLCALIGATNLLITFFALTAVAGLLPPRRAPAAAGRATLDIAVLMLTYNEAPEPVFARVAAMRDALDALDALAARGSDRRPHRFTVYVLSDTRDGAIAAREEALYRRVAEASGAVPVHYRRRAENIDRKIGNLHDWLSRYGGRHEAMLVLDADSLMTAGAIAALADRMADDPGLGVAQSSPHLIGGTTLFARLQAFATAAFGPPLSRGLARWTDEAGNFWGHNALLRLPAFATCALLPRIGPSRKLILSHDFVEAALMRRAGWGVKFFPEIAGSYEAAPPGVVEWVVRDRRWIAGNLQHLRLLGTAGLHLVSRMHLLLGALAYLMSPAWLVVLVIWALHGNGEEASAIRYFSAENPLYPVWPETTPFGPLLILGLTVAALIVPKFLALVPVLASGAARRGFGGGGALFLSCIAELLGTALIAPILMVQQTRAIVATAAGHAMDWAPADRDGGPAALGDLLRFHWIETAAGAVLVAGWLAGLVTTWLLPIAVSLVLAAPIAWLMARPAPAWLFRTPESEAPPAEWLAVAAWRRAFAEAPPPKALLAAE